MKEKPKIFRKLSRSLTANAKLTRPIDPPQHSFIGSAAHPSRAGIIDATTEPDPGPPPEVIFDRATGPFSKPRYSAAPGTRIGGS